MENKLPNHIEEFLSKDSGENVFIQLFEGNKEDIDLKTDVNITEIQLLSKLKVNDNFIKKTLKMNLYDEYINDYLRLLVSLDRKSRGEFVDINKKDRFENNLSKFNQFQNLLKVKE